MTISNGFVRAKSKFGTDVLLNAAHFCFVARTPEGGKLYPLSFNERYHGEGVATDIPFEEFAALPGFLPMDLGNRPGEYRDCFVNMALVVSVVDLDGVSRLEMRDPSGRLNDISTHATVAQIAALVSGMPGVAGRDSAPV